MSFGRWSAAAVPWRDRMPAPGELQPEFVPFRRTGAYHREYRTSGHLWGSPQFTVHMKSMELMRSSRGGIPGGG